MCLNDKDAELWAYLALVHAEQLESDLASQEYVTAFAQVHCLF